MIIDKIKKALETSHVTSDLKKLNQIKTGLEFINKMREAGAYKYNQETIVGTTEGGLNQLNQLKSTYDFLSNVKG
jgi:hypothetical protein